jgi:hypothetical protein
VEYNQSQRIALTLMLFDLFPMTHHVEGVALLENPGSDPVTERSAMKSSGSVATVNQVIGSTNMDSVHA